MKIIRTGAKKSGSIHPDDLRALITKQVEPSLIQLEGLPFRAEDGDCFLKLFEKGLASRGRLARAAFHIFLRPPIMNFSRMLPRLRRVAQALGFQPISYSRFGHNVARLLGIEMQFAAQMA